MKIALISMDQKWEDKAYNLSQCIALAKRASNQGAELAIFPEMTLTGFTMNTPLTAECVINSESVANFSAIARENKIALVAGVVFNSNNKAANTLLAFSSSGEELARYSKIHPFTFAGEDNYFNAGKALAKFQMGGFNLGLTICYDLRFPELYTALAKDCDVLINIANWPKRRMHHWRTLLQARAIENQTFVIGVNRTGIDGNGLEYEHSSMLINANGEIIVPEEKDGEIDFYNLDSNDLRQFKASFSTIQDRQPELYRNLI